MGYGTDSGIGSLAGLGLGAFLGGPFGAQIGGGLGGLAGGLFGSSSRPNFGAIQNLIDQRQQQINQFAQTLDISRNNLLSNQRNMATNAMNFMLPALQAKLGAQGLAPNSGALNSAFAAAAMPYQMQYDTLNANLTQSNAAAVNSAEASLFGPALQATGQMSMLPYQQSMATQSGFTSLFGGLLGRGLNGLSLSNSNTPSTDAGYNQPFMNFGANPAPSGFVNGFGGYGGFQTDNSAFANSLNPNTNYISAMGGK